MKKHLNTLFVTSQGAYLSKEGETVAVKVENEVRLRLPIHTLGGIVCFGNVLCSPFLLGFCAERDVSVSFLTPTGVFLPKCRGGLGECSSAAGAVPPGRQPQSLRRYYAIHPDRQIGKLPRGVAARHAGS